ncbi:MAG: transposase [Microcystaceae cyanobacterium]
MRTLTKKSTAKCNLDRYTWYLIAESKYSGCNRLAEMFEDLSHDSVNRFLVRESYEPVDLFNEVKQDIDLIGGTLSIDDTVIEKLYSQPNLSDFIGYFWSGNKHKTIKGINLITLFYTDPSGVSVPINYRLYKKKDNLSKNDYFRLMLAEVLSWGLCPAYVTGDSWYSSKDNLKFLRKQELGFMIGIAKNRQVSIKKGEYQSVESLEIGENGTIVYLKDFGEVKVFKKHFKNGIIRFYILFIPDVLDLEKIEKPQFIELKTIHWGIECYHRALKQLCGLNKFTVRKSEAILTHCFSSLRAFIQLELMRANHLIDNWYQLQRELSLEVNRNFILEHLN